MDFMVCDARHLPFKSKSFDLVFEKDALHYIPEYMRALDEIFNIAKKKIIVIEANRYEPLSFIHVTKIRGHNHFSFKKFRQIILSKATNVIFRSRESHFFPFSLKFIIGFLSVIEDFKEKIPLVNKYLLNYNIAIIVKEGN